MSMAHGFPMYDPVNEEIVGWLIRVNEPGFSAWDEFAAWLAHDPERAARYWRSADADFAIGAHLSESGAWSITPATRVMAPGRRRLAWSLMGGAVVATAAALIALLPLQTSSLYAIEAGPGVRRSVSLAGVGRIDLNGDTRVTLDKADARKVRLDRGEVLLTITHDAAHPFALSVGRATIEDIGTVFNVVRDDAGAVEIAVGEGAVSLISSGQSHIIREGQSLRLSSNGAAPVSSQVQPEAVGAWQAGRLVYDNAPIGNVAADLARAVGRNVTVAPSVAGRRFTGTLTIGNNATLVRRAAALLDVDLRVRGDEWLLTDSSRFAH